MKKSAILNGSALLAVSTIASSVLGVVLNLALPLLLSPAAYANYSTLFAYSLLVSSVFYEWIRVGVVRFSVSPEGAERDQERGSVLMFAYLVSTGILLVLTLAALAFGAANAFGLSMAAMLVAAIAQGAFAGTLALSRAHFSNAEYVLRVGGRAIGSLALGIAAALMFGTGEAVMLANALAAALSSLYSAPRMWRGATAAHFNGRDFGFFLRFGGTAAISTNLSVAAPAILRSVIINSAGAANAGGALLAIDLAQRLFSTLASSVNVIVVQRAIQATDFGDRRRVASGTMWLMMSLPALFVPCLLVLYFCFDVIALVVPVHFRDGFVQDGFVAILAMAILTLRQYSLDPVFLVIKRIGLSIVSPVLLLAILAGSTWISAAHFDTVQGALQLVLLSMVISLLATIAVLAWTRAVIWPIGEFVKLVAITIVTAVAAAILPIGGGIVGGVLRATVISVVYVAGALMLDFVGLRSMLATWIRLRQSKGR